MNKKLIPITLAAFLLAACTSKTPATQMPTDLAKPPSAAPPATPTEVLAVNNTPSTADMMPGCTVVSIKATPAPEEDSIFGPITEADWVTGPTTASLTILEFSDFQ